MIGTRSAVSAAATVLGLVVLIGPRVADPSVAIAAERLVRTRAVAAAEALDALRTAVEPGLDAARRAAAAVLTAEDPPGDRLVAAGATIAGADAAALEAGRAWARLNGARAAWRLDLAPLPDPIPAGELRSIGDQLGAVAPAADAFTDLRRRSLDLPTSLQEALAALENGDVTAAEEIVRGARADHDLVAAWEAAPATLPVWLGTTDAMISAVEHVVSATQAGDAATASAAAAAFADLADDAGAADRALRIALGEGGSALTAAPLERLATALRAIEDARAAAAAMAEAGDR